MSNLVYDGGYIITLSNNNYNLSDTPGVLGGNGKIALYNSMIKPGTDRAMIAIGGLNFDQVGKYRNNIVEGFAMNDVRLALGVRLKVEENTQQELELLAPDDPMRGVYAVYSWLGWLQESLIDALMDENQ